VSSIKIKDLFILHQGNGFDLESMEQSANSNINFISRTSQNNGVSAQVRKDDKITPFPAGYITVALGGSVLSSFVQLQPFYTAFHIMVLEPKKNMSLIEKLYYCMCIKANAYRYNYGRQANKTFKNIDLPDIIPPWVYNVPVDPIKTANDGKCTPAFNVTQWKEFEIDDLFICSTTKALIDTEAGNIPYVTRSGAYNGISGYISDKNYEVNNGNCITIGAEGITAFYQKDDFIAGIKIYVLRHNQLNAYNAMFICTILNCYKYKYSYGRARILSKIKDEIIKLPITSAGNPDWGYMEQYIKSLPYSDRI